MVRSGSRHVEVFYAVATGDPIQLWCDCPIGATHTYEDWVTRFQQPEQRVPVPSGQGDAAGSSEVT